MTSKAQSTSFMLRSQCCAYLQFLRIELQVSPYGVPYCWMRHTNLRCCMEGYSRSSRDSSRISFRNALPIRGCPCPPLWLCDPLIWQSSRHCRIVEWAGGSFRMNLRTTFEYLLRDNLENLKNTLCTLRTGVTTLLHFFCPHSTDKSLLTTISFYIRVRSTYLLVSKILCTLKKNWNSYRCYWAFKF